MNHTFLRLTQCSAFPVNSRTTQPLGIVQYLVKTGLSPPDLIMPDAWLHGIHGLTSWFMWLPFVCCDTAGSDGCSAVPVCSPLVGVTNPLSQFFPPPFHYWKIVYLLDITFIFDRWHLSNMNVIQRIYHKLKLTKKLPNEAQVNPPLAQRGHIKYRTLAGEFVEIIGVVLRWSCCGDHDAKASVILNHCSSLLRWGDKPVNNNETSGLPTSPPSDVPKFRVGGDELLWSKTVCILIIVYEHYHDYDAELCKTEIA